MRCTTLFIAALLCLAACGDDSGGDDAGAQEDARAVTVKFHLADFDTAFAGCEGQGGYSDIGPGTSVTIRSGSGDVLGAADLGAGEASSNGRQMAFCDWAVEIPDVPGGQDFYVAEVGSRGEITRSAEDLAADGWTIEVTLGSL